MMPKHRRVLTALVKNPVGEEAFPHADEAIAQLARVRLDDVRPVLWDLLEFDLVESMEVGRGKVPVAFPTARGRLWVHDHATRMQARRFGMWAAAALAASASTYGLRDAFSHAIPHLAGILAILMGTLVGVVTAATRVGD